METRFPPDAILLAAGLGTRLKPLTDTRPKALVPVAGRSLIEWAIAPLAGEGVTRFAVTAHYLAEQVAAAAAALPMRFPGCSFVLSREDALLDTGGGVRKALALVGSDPVLIAHADTFWQPGDDKPLARLWTHFNRDPDAITLLCAHPARSLGFRRSHDFCLDPSGAVTNDSGLPVIYAGVALIGRHWFDDAPEGAFSMARLFEKALAEERVRGVLLNAPWFHIGDPEARDEAEAVLRGI